MYQQHHHWANSSCYCADDDAILSSRPDALLANGGALSSLHPATSPSSYMLPPYYSGIVPPPMACSQLQTSSSSPALSTGDLIIRDGREEEQRVATRYSAEERRERIDKYRSKRNQRNFQKKITYACRKTLADSRPRVKGRFAKNGGDYTEADHHAHVPAAAAAHQSESESESPAATAAPPEWWPAVHEEGINLAELCAHDDDMLAAYLGVSSINLADQHYSCQP